LSLIDSHCHLASDSFKEDLDQVLEDCATAGISQAVVIATDLTDGRRALELSKKQNPIKLHPTLGLHPHDAKKFEQSFCDSLEKEISSYVAVGETGLDYHYDFSEHAIQKESFAWHIEMAAKVKKPLVIHCREAVEDIYEMLNVRKSQLPSSPGVMHCFAESWEWAVKFLDLGFHLSFSGILTFKAGQNIRDVASKAPLNRMLIETDAPYLAPVPFRGKRNTPALMVHTFEHLCKIRTESRELIEDTIHQSTINLFSI
jgi:TatD DNase family protein